VPPEPDDGGSASVLLDDLSGFLPPERLRSGSMERHLYSHDASMLAGEPIAVCFPESAEEVRRIVASCAAHGRPFVARGSGTGLTGGATPPVGAVVISTVRMNRVLEVDEMSRTAWVEPGVLNLDLTRRVERFGLHFAPDPSSQQSCSIGGNVANNSGGPHCLADGVTAAHVMAIDVVLPDGSTARLGGSEAEPAGYDLRGVFVGSEGMFGVATAVLVRLTRTPSDVSTMLIDFVDVAHGAGTVSAIIADGIVPAALEMMDRLCIVAVEEYLHAGLPTDAAAVLLVETTGDPARVAEESRRITEIALANGARTVRVAADDAERALLWKGRKSAFGAVARIAPNYYLHDTVVPRHRLTAVLSGVYEIADRHRLQVMNVFHAGDGNLHPILMFDRRDPGVMERVHAAGEEIVRLSVENGGVLSGEHGIGLEKRDLMPLMFDDDDLHSQDLLRSVFDPRRLANPGKVLPTAATCGDLQGVPEGTWI